MYFICYSLPLKVLRIVGLKLLRPFKITNVQRCLFFLIFLERDNKNGNAVMGMWKGGRLGHCQGFAKLLVTTVLLLFVYITRSYTPDAVPNIVYLHILYCLGESVVW